MGIFGNAISGINAAQLGLLTTEHNISNVNTPGYSRQRTIQTTESPVFTGSGFIGQGTRVSTIERQYSAFLTAQVNQSQTNASELDKYLSQVSLIDNMLADPSAGLSPALQEFFRGVQQVAADPASLPARQALASTAQALSARFQGIESRLSEIYDGVNSQIVSAVAGVNSLATQIGDLNQRILVASAGSQQTPNDLLDQRDQLVTDLNKLIRVQVVNDPSGAFNVFIGNGQQLVVGPMVSQLGVQASPSDPSRLVVGLKTATGVQVLPDSSITGGELGGLVRFRNESLDTTSNQLGQIAASLTLTFNAQHALGQDLLGQIAVDAGFQDDFFNPLTPNVIANSNNTSGASITASFVAPTAGTSGFFTDLTASDYKLVANGGGNFTLTRLSDNKIVGPAGATLATLNSVLSNPADPFYDPQGFTLAVVGAPVANESFLVEPTRNVARNFALNTAIAADTRLIAAAAPVRGQPAATNVGSAKVTSTLVATGYSVLVPSALPQSITFNAPSLPAFPQGSLTGPFGIVAYQSGATLTFNGISIVIEGLPTGGDQFVIERNTSGVSDARNMLKLGQLQTQNTTSGQTATYQGAYASLVSDIGNRTHATSVTRDAQQTLLEQATASRESQSGVNLDEEAANLIRFQQAYQASAKSLDIASRLFDSILALGS